MGIFNIYRKQSKKIIISLSLIGLLLTAWLGLRYLPQSENQTVRESQLSLSEPYDLIENQGGPETELHPLAIESLRDREYPGSDLIVEQTLTSGSNYSRYIASYKSDGLRIFGLLTVPISDPSSSPQDDNRKYPAIVFNHGYIPPDQYVTTQRYVDYVDSFARNGYVVFKPDYRGHGNSEGDPEGAYFSAAYVVDVLNALASLQRYPDVNADKIGMWGHSMGGSITLRSLVIAPEQIKAAVIWAGVVGSYPEILNDWNASRRWTPKHREQHAGHGGSRQSFVDQYGKPEENPEFWQSIDPTNFIDSITTPVQIHHAKTDNHVPIQFSQSLVDKLQATDKPVEWYIYEQGDHNLSGDDFGPAMDRSLEYFDRYLK